MLIHIFFILSVLTGSTSVVKEEPVLETEPDCRLASVDPRFQSHVLSLKRFAEVPPIVHIVSIAEDDMAYLDEAQIEDGMTSDSEFLSDMLEQIPTRLIPYFDTLSEIVDDYTDRVYDQFPNVFYDEEIDGTVLRNISATIESLAAGAAASRSDKRLVSLLARQSGWMRKWTWTIVSMMEYIVKRPFLSMHQTELILVSLAPTIHAFLHALFFLEIDFQDLFHGFKTIVSTISKYHPIYVDDPVWFIRLGREFSVTSYPIFNSLPSFVSDSEFFENAWGDDFIEFRTNPKSLVTKTHSLLNSPVFQHRRFPETFRSAGVIESLSLVLFTIQYFREFEPVVFARLLDNGLVDLKIKSVERILFRIITTATIVNHHTAVRGMLEIFGHLILDHYARLERVVPVDLMAKRLVPINRHDRIINILSQETMGMLMDQLASISKFDLAGDITLDGCDIEAIYKEILMDVFEPDNMIFTIGPTGLYIPANSSSTTLIGVGRLIGLVLKSGNDGNILGSYIRHLPSPRSDGGIFQTLFFGSEHIRTGFNHVILENTIESIYPDSHSFVQFLDFINQYGLIVD